MTRLPRSRSTRAYAPLLLIAAFSSLVGGCMVSEESCSANQEFIGDTVRRCECVDGYVPADDGLSCVACGDNEEAQSGKCECVDGFGRTAPGAACVETTLGGACTADTECFDPYPLCANAATDGYCTKKGCTDNSECEEQWTCIDDGADGYCKRPPTGLNSSCASSSDCDGYEASFCEEFLSKTCQVAGCAEGTSTCHADWVCCDLRGVLGVSLCVPPDELDGAGECPAGAGKPVTP